MLTCSEVALLHKVICLSPLSVQLSLISYTFGCIMYDLLRLKIVCICSWLIMHAYVILSCLDLDFVNMQDQDLIVVLLEVEMIQKLTKIWWTTSSVNLLHLLNLITTSYNSLRFELWSFLAKVLASLLFNSFSFLIVRVFTTNKKNRWTFN